MFNVVRSFKGARGEDTVTVELDAMPFEDAIAFAAWLLERPTARHLAGYTVTVVEVEA